MNLRTLATVALMSCGAFVIAGCSHHHGHQRTGGEVVDDSAITTKVKSALLAEKDVNSFDIKVQTFDGVVQLSGFVDSKWQIDKAVEVASSIKGVQSVKNDLVHKPVK